MHPDPQDGFGRHSPKYHTTHLCEVTRVDGYVGNFTVTIRKKARYVIDRPLHRVRDLPGKMPQESNR